MNVFYSILLFLIAGICEIAGGYLIWLWVKDSRHWWMGLAGGALLVLYGIVATLQIAISFSRVYAAYGGIFIAMSIYWGYKIDGVVPDKYDLIGGAICLIGVCVIMFAPRE
jgi:small multidrug resistance family-3 protein